MFCVDCTVATGGVCRDVWCSAASATTATFRSEATDVPGAVPVGVHVGGVLVAIVLLKSLIKCST